MTTHITDDTIEAAIEQHDDPGHDDAFTVNAARTRTRWRKSV